MPKIYWKSSKIESRAVRSMHNWSYDIISRVFEISREQQCTDTIKLFRKRDREDRKSDGERETERSKEAIIIKRGKCNKISIYV